MRTGGQTDWLNVRSDGTLKHTHRRLVTEQSSPQIADYAVKIAMSFDRIVEMLSHIRGSSPSSCMKKLIIQTGSGILNIETS